MRGAIRSLLSKSSIWLPYLWLLVFFLAPFLIVAKLSVSEPAIAQPPYTPEVMQAFFDQLSPAISLERIGSDINSQKRFFTHSVLGDHELNEQQQPGDWNRTLDYLFLDSNILGFAEEIKHDTRKVMRVTRGVT